MTQRRRPGRTRSTTRCALCVLGVGLAGAWLVLLVPGLFRPDAGTGPLGLVVPALLVLVLAAGALWWRPTGPGADGR